MKWLTMVAAVLVAFAVSSLAMADEKDAAKGKGGAIREKLLEKYDANKNGKLDPDEIEKAKADRGQGDAKGARPGAEEMQTRMLKRFDKDGDGKLNDEEKAAAKEAMKNRAGGAAGGRPNMEEAIKRFDKDGDGKLNDEEKAAARAAFQERRKGKKPE